MPYVRGDLYWAKPSGTVGTEIQKDRPYMIMSRTTANQRSVVAIPFTSDKDPNRQLPAYCIRIPAAHVTKDPASADAIVDSIAQCHQIRILAVESLRKRIGTVNPPAMLSIQLGLSYLLDIQ